jgi:hypothetical protein
MGEPATMKAEDGTPVTGPGKAQRWTYTGRYKGEIDFDGDCRFPAGVRLSEQLAQVASDQIAHPNIDYRFKEGKLVRFDDLKPKPTPAQALLKEPRQDYPLGAQAHYLRTADGQTILAGLVRGESAGLDVRDEAGKKALKVIAVGRALAEDGKVAAFAEQEIAAVVDAEGAFLAGFRMALKPGKYTLLAGALDPKTGKGSIASIPVDVPNLNRGELSQTMMILDGLEEGVAPDETHPYAAFALGDSRMRPHFGPVFKTTDQPVFFYQFYDAKPDDTGKRSALPTLQILKDGKGPVAASTPDAPTEGPVGGTWVGPVPLGTERFGVGKYTARLKIKDNVAGKDYTEEIRFEVK